MIDHGSRIARAQVLPDPDYGTKNVRLKEWCYILVLSFHHRGKVEAAEPP